MIHKILMGFISAILLSVMLGCGGSDSGGATDTNTTAIDTDSDADGTSSSYLVTDLQDGSFKIDFTITNSATAVVYYSFSKEDVSISNYETVLRDAASGGYSYTATETTTLTCTKNTDTNTSFSCTDLVDADPITLTPGDGIYLFKGTARSATDITFENRLTTITIDSATDGVVDDTDTISDPGYVINDDYELSGVFTTSFNSASEKTWYTDKQDWQIGDSSGTTNQANYSRTGDSVNILIGARSASTAEDTDGVLSFYVNFPSGVTTGIIEGTYVSYQDTQIATAYLRMSGIIGDTFNINITDATDDGVVVHVKGSFSTTIYDGLDSNGNLNDPKSLSVEFEFDAHEL